MDFTPASLLAAIVVSSLGAGYFLFGRRQRRAPQLAGGIAMLVVPLLTSNPWTIWSVGLGAVVAVALALRAGWSTTGPDR